MSKKKKFSKYCRKKMFGIKHQGWVSGVSEPQAPSSSEHYSDFSYSYSVGPRSTRAVLPSGKVAWVSTDKKGKIKIS